MIILIIYYYYYTHHSSGTHMTLSILRRRIAQYSNSKCAPRKLSVCWVFSVRVRKTKTDGEGTFNFIQYAMQRFIYFCFSGITVSSVSVSFQFKYFVHHICRWALRRFNFECIFLIFSPSLHYISLLLQCVEYWKWSKQKKKTRIPYESIFDRPLCYWEFDIFAYLLSSMINIDDGRWIWFEINKLNRWSPIPSLVLESYRASYKYTYYIYVHKIVYVRPSGSSYAFYSQTIVHSDTPM